MVEEEKGLAACEALRGLNMEENDLGVEGVLGLAEVLARLPDLQALTLADNRLTHNGQDLRRTNQASESRSFTGPESAIFSIAV